MNFTDSIFFPIHDNIIIVNSAGYDNHEAKI